MMQGKPILIFGCNGFGLEVAAKIRSSDQDVLLVDNDTDKLKAAEQAGLGCVQVDYQRDENLRELGLGKGVASIFVLFEDEPENVFLTISARALDPDLKIYTVVQSANSTERMLAAGASKTIDPYEITGRKIVDLISRPLVAEVMEQTLFGEQDLNVAEIEITENSQLNGKKLYDLSVFDEYNLILLGVVDNEISGHFIFANARINHLLDAGDLLVLIGPVAEIQRFKQQVVNA
ncbi:MAG: NAD-binding protein [Chromatiales bacterium]|jgi:voltage-gated potassium channel